MSQVFLNAIKSRRSIYALGNKLPKPEKDVAELIKSAVRPLPSSFNVQSSRIVILFGNEHKKAWELAKEELKKKVQDPEAFKATEEKVNNCFAAGAGTILFYEDTDAVKKQQEAYPAYAANFPVWSEHASAMAQFSVWTALAAEGIGATLQHYSPLVDAPFAQHFSIPKEWKLIAQMPFGSIQKPAGEKTSIEDSKRFIVRGL